MTTAVLRDTSFTHVPATQNTAPVLEFSCLYTHDLRRKQKRWQDGFLRYHTFNKRVMVYDVPRNFLGDLHWTEGGDLQEGDEMTLEKGGIMVQVAEEVGRTTTDLSELLHKPNRQTPNKTTTHALHAAHARPITQRTTPGTVPPQMKHKSLSQLLGPSKGHIGKAALPTRSPFEIRNGGGENGEWEAGREPKRRKTDAWNVSRTTRFPDVSSVRKDAATTTPKPRAKKQAGQASRSQTTLRVQEFIDISSDTEESPDANQPDAVTKDTPAAASSPGYYLDRSSLNRPLPRANGMNGNNGLATGGPAVPNTTGPGESPSVRQVHRKNGVSIPRRGLPAAPRAPVPCEALPLQRAVMRRSPPVSTHNSVVITSDGRDANDTVPVQLPNPLEDTNSQKRKKALKLVSNVPRRMLVFQDRLAKSPAPSMEQARRDDYAPALPAHQRNPQEGSARTEQREQAQHDQVEPAVALAAEAPTTRARTAQQRSRPVHETTAAATKVRRKPPAAGISDDEIVILSSPEPPRQNRTWSKSLFTRRSSPQPHVPALPAPNQISIQLNITNDEDDLPVVSAPSPQPRPRNSTRRTAAAPANSKSKPYKAPFASTIPAPIPAPDPGIDEPGPEQETATTPDAAADTTDPDAAMQEADTLGPWSKEAFDLMDWRPPTLMLQEEAR